MVDGNFDEALAAIAAAGRGGAAVVNSINPDRIAGQQTVAFEIVDALGESAQAVALPVGNAGNITAAWAGFCRYAEAGVTPSGRRPRMIGFRPPARRRSAEALRGVEGQGPVATAIRIGNPASWSGAETARDESGGVIEAVSDEEILDMQHRIAELEGSSASASAAGVAGVARLASRAASTPPRAWSASSPGTA